MNKKKRIAILLAVIILYIVLVAALFAAEHGAPDASITSVPVTLWYTLTTLTTVGYGDVYPVTAAGKIIGAVFQFLSLGLLVFLIGLAVTVLRERLLWVRLRFRRRQPWYIFTTDTGAAQTLARAIRREEPKAQVIFCGDGGSGKEQIPDSLSAGVDPAQITAFQKGCGPTSVFCMDDDFMKNETAAQALADLPCEVYCLAEYDPPARPRLTVFDPYSGCARLYWQQHPVRSERERIVLIGEGKYAEALLEKGLQQNVTAVPGRMEYRVFGDFSGFCREHPYLGRVFAADGADMNRDSLIFSAEPWDADFALLTRADRIIICYDEEERALETLARLRRYVPVSCQIYARLSADLAGVTAFGSEEETFSPEMVMRRKLDATARALHDRYLASQPGTALPAWEQLEEFAKDSNRAAADHLALKVRILLEEKAEKTGPIELTPERCRAAYEAFCKADEGLRSYYRRIEHERWVRFHVLHNWQYAPVRDNARRRHPLLVDFEDLTPEDQAKDDYGWELLGQLGAGGEPK